MSLSPTKDAKRRTSIAVTGATGFIGKAIIEGLRDSYECVGLSRSKRDADSERGPHVWRTCDLFNLRQVETSLQGCDAAIYLVHSMMPSARLTQASFADLDLLLADNFARGAEHAGVEHILYVGGLIPDGVNLSEHLRSRREVERALASRGARVTVLRAGLVVGAGGSSFQMLTKLVERLPAMICPRWTESRTQPIAVEDVVAIVRGCLATREVQGEIWDVGGSETRSYKQMIQDVAAAMDRKPMLLRVPWFSPTLSRLWVALVTGQSIALVGPLVESLRHDMLPRELELQRRLGLTPTPWRVALARALERDRNSASSPSSHRATSAKSAALEMHRRPRRNTVRSVQRLPRPQNAPATWVAQEYLRWLPRLLPRILVVERDENVERLRIRPLPPLLILRFAPERSTDDRALFFVDGGLLADTRSKGRLEFRVAPDASEILAAIHEYSPTLPWYIYTTTQALAHLWVMHRFGRHLRRARPASEAARAERDIAT